MGKRDPYWADVDREWIEQDRYWAAAERQFEATGHFDLPIIHWDAYAAKRREHLSGLRRRARAARIERRCKWCGKPLGRQKENGRPREYHPGACRQAAYRSRQRAKAIRETT